MPYDKFGRLFDENLPLPENTQRQPTIRPDGSGLMAPPNQGAGAGYAPFDLNAGVIKPKMGATKGGGFSNILSSLLGGVQNQPVGMPTPVDPPAAAPTAVGQSGGRGLAARGVSPALTSVLTGSQEAGGGDTSTIQALLAQLLRRDQRSAV